MLRLVIESEEYWDSKEEVFIPGGKSVTIQLEHSLISISKWEAKWNKPFLSSQKTDEELVDYIRCMTLTQNVSPDIYYRITRKQLDEITAYIDAPMTATTFSENEQGSKGGKQIVTSELVYYWMVAHQIPFECEKWHFNRLLTLIRICSIKNQPPKKMGKQEIMKRNRALNDARRKRLGSKG